MKIRAERAPLADALAWVAQAIAKNPASPALSGIRLTAQGSTLTASAFDYDRAHTARVDVDADSEGECLIHGNFLRAIVGAMSSSEVGLTLDGNLTIKSGGSRYRTQPLRVEDYPTVPALPAAAGEAGASDLTAAVNAVKHPIDDGSPFPAVRGLRIEGGNELDLFGMDRFRLARAVVPWKWTTDLAATVHSGTFVAAVKGMSGSVTLRAEDGLFGLSDATRAVTMRTYADEYSPKWRSFLEVNLEDPTISLDSGDLKDAIKRVRELNIADESAITVAFGDGQLTIDAHTDGIGDGTESVEGETEGSASRGFNPRLLTDALTAAPDGPMTIHAGAKGLWIFQPADRDHLTFAVMTKTLPGGTR